MVKRSVKSRLARRVLDRVANRVAESVSPAVDLHGLGYSLDPAEEAVQDQEYEDRFADEEFFDMVKRSQLTYERDTYGGWALGETKRLLSKNRRGAVRLASGLIGRQLRRHMEYTQRPARMSIGNQDYITREGRIGVNRGRAVHAAPAMSWKQKALRAAEFAVHHAPFVFDAYLTAGQPAYAAGKALWAGARLVGMDVNAML